MRIASSHGSRKRASIRRQTEATEDTGLTRWWSITGERSSHLAANSDFACLRTREVAVSLKRKRLRRNIQGRIALRMGRAGSERFRAPSFRRLATPLSKAPGHRAPDPNVPLIGLIFQPPD